MDLESPRPPVGHSVRTLALDVDRLLRGRFTSAERLREGRLELPTRTLLVACAVLGAFYGAAMGLFAVTTRGAGEGLLQVLSSAAKVPLLFLLTLCVTFPSLYVVSALARSRLRPGVTLRLLLAAVAVALAVLASLGPVTAFFTLSTDSYPFMKLLNVAFFAAAGLVGCSFLWRALASVLVDGSAPSGGDDAPEDTGAPEAMEAPEAVTPAAERGMRRVFAAWLVLFGVVGAQMGWILRPFVGEPEAAFSWFRARESNFLHGFFRTLAELVG